MEHLLGGQSWDIFNRFIWTATSRDACRWEQAFSVDGGRAWETNWIMSFTRQDEEQLR